MTQNTETNGGKGVDLNEASRLVEQLEKDLALARSGHKDIATLQSEVEKLRDLLAGGPQAQQGVDEGLQGLKDTINAIGDELFDDAVTASRYAAWIGRLLGL